MKIDISTLPDFNDFSDRYLDVWHWRPISFLSFNILSSNEVVLFVKSYVKSLIEFFIYRFLFRQLNSVLKLCLKRKASIMHKHQALDVH